jgi:hypothetical protein
MAQVIEAAAAGDAVPETGQLVSVRDRRWFVRRPYSISVWLAGGDVVWTSQTRSHLR